MKLTTYKKVIATLGLSLFSLTSLAASWPDRPVTLVVPYPPGGPTDIVARVVAQGLGEQLKQTVVVENKSGAGGNIGADYVARSAADGYTLLMGTTAHAINMSLFSNLNYDTITSFTPVSLLTKGPLVLVARKDLPANNVQELIEYAKQQPGQVTFASSGNGQSTHLSAELFNYMADTEMVHVPYRGSAPALIDLVGGQVDVMFDPMLSAMPQVKSGHLKALAITGAERSSASPELPTIDESGLSGYEATAWNGLLLPTGTPSDVVETLSNALNVVLADEEVKAKFAAQGFESQWMSSADFGQYLAAEINKWKTVVDESGATVN